VDVLVNNTALGPAPTGLIATGSTTSRLLADRWGEIKNVKDYGATGDGSVDDAAAIQLALNAARLAGGGRVFIGDGTYRLDSQLTIGNDTHLDMMPGAILKRNWVGVVGSKPDNATLKNYDAPAGGSFYVDPGPFVPSTYNTGIKITGGEFTVVNSTKTGSHVALYAVRNSSIRNCRFTGVEQDWNVALFGDYINVEGLDIDSGDVVWEDGIHVLGGSHIRISNCRIKCGDDAIAIINHLNLSISDVTVSNCTVESNEGHAIRIGQTRTGLTAAYADPTNKVERIAIRGIDGIAGTDKNGLILIEHKNVTAKNLVRDVTISDVSLEHGTLAAAPRSGTSGSGDWGVDLDGGLRITMSNVNLSKPIRSGFRIVGADNVSLLGCRVHSQQSTEAGYNPIDATDCENLAVANCDLEYDQHHIIVLDGCTNSIISGNRLGSIKASHAGVLLDNVTVRTTVSGNTFTGATDSQGVRVLHASVESLVISGNNFGNVTAPILLSATPSQLEIKANVSEAFATIKTISSGSVTFTSGLSGFHVLAAESGTADSLSTISGALVIGQRLTVVPDAGDTITLKHDNAGSNELHLNGGVDAVLNSVTDSLTLIWNGAEWVEIGRSMQGGTVTFTGGDATPSVAGGKYFLTAGTTAITDFDDGVVGQTITVKAKTSITITDAGDLELVGNFAMTTGDTITLTMIETGKWSEISRSDIA
jgi:polygalacturonase